MKKTPILVVLFLLVSLPGLYFAKKLIPVLKSKQQQETSDAKDLKGKITLAIDDWIGYFPISSSRMKKAMRSEGYLLDISNDGGDYPARVKKLRDGELDFAVVTVDSYILNAAPADFPATIVTILDESKGGDAMVAYTNVVSSLDSFKSFTAQTMPKIAYTPASPSQHLLKAISSHFNVPALKNIGRNQRVETKDSQEALKFLIDKKVSVAILWEPNVSKALEIPGVAKILGTESTSRLIVDILVVNREFALKNPEKVDLLLKTYFRTLKFYADNPEELEKDISAELKLPRDSVKKMVDGVAWVNLSENCQSWFGVSVPGQISEQGLIDTIQSTVEILVGSGDFKEDPLPDKDPYRIVNSSFIQQIYNAGIKNGFAALVGKPGPGRRPGRVEPALQAADRRAMGETQARGQPEHRTHHVSERRRRFGCFGKGKTRRHGQPPQVLSHFPRPGGRPHFVSRRRRRQSGAFPGTGGRGRALPHHHLLD